MEISTTRQESWKLFNKIASRYDWLNRVLSFGIDLYWRKSLADHLSPRSKQDILDLATGTGDQLLALLKHSDRVRSAVGMDLAQDMLNLGKIKVQGAGFGSVASMKLGDAVQIPAQDKSFDAVSMSFGIRNVPDVSKALREIFRVLKPGGRSLILEFSIPQFPLMRGLYLFYLRNILPWLGSWVSGDPVAYRYLNQTIETFPYGENFCELLRNAGFSQVRYRSYTFGIVCLYIGEKALNE